ncbi:UDP-glucose dehydrogenase family protein [Alicyclobacillus sp. ALC3]|uniref:UDP-glucose dehydrogenase family protein n=1 Tax=Alicyclobacillus sp. ALC3 TaxID=2796143 RepID=UPI002379E2F6|nr:UDP-glucose/GDP-mannose dehydrogenase family protein [Alicyclobacillus sp. ALC3]WDL95251.1 UDP-glucose/GDP-mannose dehydrogenase family protein [Alicyclobacillus sp. ALC3]
MNVLIVGTGYVGLVTGVCFASHGHEVLCVDADARKVRQLQAGHCPIYEDGLESLLREQLQAGRLRFAAQVPPTAAHEVALIAVGTPSGSDGTADLTNVFAVAKELGRKLQPRAVLATKSTVPVGTGDKLERMLVDMGRTDLHVASTPEFLREGTALKDTLYPTRLVFGIADVHSSEVLKRLHAGVEAPAVLCSRATAEMIKYASNAFLATKISFINEIANICARVDADVSQVAIGMGMDPRIGGSFLRAGLGYGGSCFPKDTRALVNIAGDVDYDFKLLKAVVEVNQLQRTAPLRQLTDWLGDLSGKHIAILGVAFKPGTDDTRESAALELARVLRDQGARLTLYDPVVRRCSSHSGSPISVLDDPYLAVLDADAAVVVTEWSEIVDLDWPLVRQRMRQPFLYDGRNVLAPYTMQSIGFTFANVGRRAMSAALQV